MWLKLFYQKYYVQVSLNHATKETEVETDKPETTKPGKSTLNSDSDEDDWTNIANKTRKTIQNFDDLFNSDQLED